jgi:hypothetical protein
MGASSVVPAQNSLQADRMEQTGRILDFMLEALAEVDAPYAVFGGLLAILYGKRQVTGDVDLLVPKSGFEPLKNALRRRGYQIREHRFLLRVVPPAKLKPIADLVMVESSTAVRMAFMARVPTRVLGRIVHVIPRGEFVAQKFEASVRSRRLSRDRRVDVYDIIGVLERGFGPEDERAAQRLAVMMYPGAAADLASLLDDLRHGRWPRVVKRAQLRSALLHRQAAVALRR